MEKLEVSLVIIAKNEAANIARCINSVPWVSDIVVVDSHSTDGTDQIAEKLGARVFQEEWRGYGKQKQLATELAKYDWIISLDADEGLSEALSKEIHQTLSSEPQLDGYECPRLSWHLGRWIHHGGWYPDRQLRVFHRGRANWSDDVLHEKVRAKRAGRFKHNIHHWVFSNLADQVNTNNEYSTLGAEDFKGAGKRFSLFKLLVKPPSKFIETYFLKLGLLDGLSGFVISVGAAYSVFLKHAKLWEFELTAKDPESR